MKQKVSFLFKINKFRDINSDKYYEIKFYDFIRYIDLKKKMNILKFKVNYIIKY